MTNKSLRIKLVKKRDYPEIKKLERAFEISDDGDVCIAAGGDGTFIKAAREFDGPILPLRGGEDGSTGYYSDMEINRIDTVITALKSKKYSVEDISSKIEVSFGQKKYFAVNEILLRNLLKEVYFKVYHINKGERKLLYPFVMSGDGLLVSGRVGSTAYNRNAGGPIILSPKVICLTFLFVESPFSNPIVLDNDSELFIEVVKGKGMLTYDNIDIGEAAPGDHFSIKQSDKPIKMIRLDGFREDFSQKLARMIKSKMKDEAY